jgi:hypothetical protein
MSDSICGMIRSGIVLRGMITRERISTLTEWVMRGANEWLYISGMIRSGIMFRGMITCVKID